MIRADIMAMIPGTSHPPPAVPDRRMMLIPLALWLILVVCQLVGIERADIATQFAGPDSYMRMITLEQLIVEGDWFNHRIDRINPPHGDVLHWTRLYDLVLLVFAYPLTWVMSVRDAVSWISYILPPLMFIVSLTAMLWVMRLVDPYGYRYLFVCGAMIAPTIFFAHILGRIDHHGFLLLLFILICGFSMRALLHLETRCWAVGGGLMTGIGLWASPELFLALIPFHAALVLIWIGAPRDDAALSLRSAPAALSLRSALAALSLRSALAALSLRSAPAALSLRYALAARCGLVSSLAMMVVVVAAVLIDYPNDAWLAPAYDRLSIVHAVFCLGVVGFWLQAALLVNYRGVSLLCSGLYVLLAAALMLFLFPRFLYGFASNVDPRISSLWQEKISEMQSILPHDAKSAVDFIALTLPIWPICGYIVWFSRHCGWRLFTMREAAMIGYLLIMLLGCFLAGVARIRLAIYFSFAVIVVYLIVWNQLQPWLETLKPRWRDLTRALGIFILIGGPPVHLLWPSLFDHHADDTAIASEQGNRKDCDLRDVAMLLQSVFDAPKTLIMPLNFSAELLYRTPHNVIAAPYHRNADGIYDLYQILRGDDDARSHRLIKAYDADAIIICEEKNRPTNLSARLPSYDSLYMRLVRDDPPAWLRRIDLSLPPPPGFGLYRVIDAPHP